MSETAGDRLKKDYIGDVGDAGSARYRVHGRTHAQLVPSTGRVGITRGEADERMSPTRLHLPMFRLGGEPCEAAFSRSVIGALGGEGPPTRLVLRRATFGRGQSSIRPSYLCNMICLGSPRRIHVCSPPTYRSANEYLDIRCRGRHSRIYRLNLAGRGLRCHLDGMRCRM